jgi:hypothetical protein
MTEPLACTPDQLLCFDSRLYWKRQMVPIFPLVAVGPGLAAAAGTVAAQSSKNDTEGAVRFFGRFSPAFVGFDDGGDTTTALVDNGNSNTRFT